MKTSRTSFSTSFKNFTQKHELILLNLAALCFILGVLGLFFEPGITLFTIKASQAIGLAGWSAPLAHGVQLLSLTGVCVGGGVIYVISNDYAPDNSQGQMNYESTELESSELLFDSFPSNDMTSNSPDYFTDPMYSLMPCNIYYSDMSHHVDHSDTYRDD